MSPWTMQNYYGPDLLSRSSRWKGHFYNRFSYLHRDEDWHYYTREIIDQKPDYASRRVRVLIELDLQKTLATLSVS